MAIGSNIGIIGGSKAGSPVRHGAGMARNLARVEFATFLEMAAHLDGWAADGLTDSAAWEDVLVGSRAWLDYSARNQVLLASYGAEGPVAGAETWRLVPSTTEGRGCAVQAGEHGYPVRVPVTTGGTEPDPYLGGHRPTRATVGRWEWRPVFSGGQPARRPPRGGRGVARAGGAGRPRKGGPPAGGGGGGGARAPPPREARGWPRGGG